MFYLSLAVFSIFSFYFSLQAAILPIEKMENILPFIEEETCLILNVTEVLTESSLSLGSALWRRDVRQILDDKSLDLLTYYAFKNVPAKAVDSQTSLIIRELQKRGVTVLAFTSRGRSEWYGTPIPNIDIETKHSLELVGIDFSLSRLPKELEILEKEFSHYYVDGIIYGGKFWEKGDLLQVIFESAHYHPKKVILVDDEIASLKNTEQALEALGIPFLGLQFSKSNDQPYDPMIALLQLEWLLRVNVLLTDEEAKAFKNEMYQIDETAHLLNLWEEFAEEIGC